MAVCTFNSTRWSWHRRSLRTSKKTNPLLRECGDMFAIRFQLSERRFQCRSWKFLDVIPPSELDWTCASCQIVDCSCVGSTTVSGKSATVVESTTVGGTVRPILGITCRPSTGRTKGSSSEESNLVKSNSRQERTSSATSSPERGRTRHWGPGFDASPTRTPRNPYLASFQLGCRLKMETHDLNLLANLILTADSALRMALTRSPHTCASNRLRRSMHSSWTIWIVRPSVRLS